MDLSEALRLLKGDATDEAAWNAVYLRLWPYVLTTAFRTLGGDTQSAEDIAQTVFLKALERRFELVIRTEREFKGYLGQMAHRAAIDLLRKRKRTSSPPIELVQHLQKLNEHVNELEERVEELKERYEITSHEIRDLLFQFLSESQHELLTLVLEGLSILEITERTGVSEKAIRQRIRRLKQFLRERLQE